MIQFDCTKLKENLLWKVEEKEMKTVYDFTVKDRRGNEVSLGDYKGKVLLIVNTATGCGFTPHYEPLEAMYKEMKEK